MSELISVIVLCFVLATVGNNRHLKTRRGFKALVGGAVVFVLSLLLLTNAGLAVRGGGVRIPLFTLAALCGSMGFNLFAYFLND